MDEENEFIYCKKCGSKMRKVQRCCLKCGAINYLNEENDSMESFQQKADEAKEKIKKDYRFVSSEDVPDRVFLAKHAGSKTLCLLLNIIVYLIPIALFFLLQPVPINKELVLDYKYSLILFSYTYIWFLILGLQLLYMKTDKRWWSVFVPFYSVYNWFDITMHNGWLMFVFFIPIVGEVLFFISLWNLGERFERNKFLCLVVPFIMVPLISYNDDCIYDGITYTFSNESSNEKAIMKNYKLNSGLSKYMIFITVICLIINGYYWGREYIKYKYVRDVKIILEKTKKSELDCNNIIDPNSFVGEYYISFYNASEDLEVELPSKYDVFYKSYNGYIKVVNTNGEKKYYINMTNGYYGVRNKTISQIKKEDIEYGTKLIFKVPSGKISCRIK